MQMLSILVLAFGLSMDAMAVAAARGLLVAKIELKHVLLVATFFGGFQALMPLLGYFLGSRLGRAIEHWDHWVVFAVLGGIGGKMLWEARKTEPLAGPVVEEARQKGEVVDAFGLRMLLVLAVATSVDALAAGFTLPLMDAPLLTSLATIGITTAALSAFGLFAGQRFGAALGSKLDALGGLVLIGLGTKTLIEHLGAH